MGKHCTKFVTNLRNEKLCRLEDKKSVERGKKLRKLSLWDFLFTFRVKLILMEFVDRKRIGKEVKQKNVFFKVRLAILKKNMILKTLLKIFFVSSFVLVMTNCYKTKFHESKSTKLGKPYKISDILYLLQHIATLHHKFLHINPKIFQFSLSIIDLLNSATFFDFSFPAPKFLFLVTSSLFKLGSGFALAPSQQQLRRKI